MHRFTGLVLLTAMSVPGAVVAQGFPARPVRIIVGLAPGGATDLTARAAAQAIRELGQPVLDRKSTRLNSSHSQQSRMPSSA